MKTTMLRGLLLLTLTGGCTAIEETSVPAAEPLAQTAQAQEDDNGLAFNGLAFNGLAFNGLAFNGLAFNGLSSGSFNTWFQQDPTNANLFMKYLVRCAVPSGQTRTYTSGSTTYTWPGSLGLAPDWANGSAATTQEQQTVSACLGALTNKYGRSVLLSIQGTGATGQTIPTTASELSTYSLHEGCFFGNLFNDDEGLFVGNDQGVLNSNQSSLRACALEPGACAPALTHIGDCHKSCIMDSTGSYFTWCYHGGKVYHALSTRLRPQEVLTCGDNRCQFPEVCTKGSPDACKADCGSCG